MRVTSLISASMTLPAGPVVRNPGNPAQYHFCSKNSQFSGSANTLLLCLLEKFLVKFRRSRMLIPMHLPFWTPCKSLLRCSVEHGVQALTGETIGAQHLNNQKLQQKFKELKANGLPFTCQSLNFLWGLDDGAYPECLKPRKLRLRFSKAMLYCETWTLDVAAQVSDWLLEAIPFQWNDSSLCVS